MLWHRRLGHINFKNINKLVKDNLVRGLPTKRFENYQTCIACLKGKQHRASCKSKVLNPITKPLFMIHMDLFGPTFVSSLMYKKYCLVVTDDYSRFTWVFFLASKDETSEILKNFINEIENLVDKKVKIIRCDNGTKFKNKVVDDFYREKDEAVSTACYVQNRVLVVKPHNKTPYELFRGFKPALRFMRPFGCHVTILNTLDNLGKFDGKSDECFFVRYSLISKAFREQSLMNLHVSKENLMQDVGNGEPKFAADDQKQVKDGPDNENMKKIINTASSYDQDSPKDMFTIGSSHTLEADQFEIKPTIIAKALSDSSWVEAMQEELLQFKLQQVWILMDLPIGKRVIRTKWVFKNKKDEGGL
ncbi:putative ribonuclease H-like domain-containing protein [Tanacetum coccineum]